MVLLMQGSVALLNYVPSSAPLNHYLASSRSQSYICFVLFGLFSLVNLNFRIDSSPLMFALLCLSVSVCELKYAHFSKVLWLCLHSSSVGDYFVHYTNLG